MALGDKFLEFLQTLWIFFSNLCIAILSYAFRALWTVLTYLFEMLWNMFVAALIVLKDYGPSQLVCHVQDILRRWRALSFSCHPSTHVHSDRRARIHRRPSGTHSAHVMFSALSRL